jgi:hypothetical protein
MNLDELTCDKFVSICNNQSGTTKNHFDVHFAKNRTNTDRETKIFNTFKDLSLTNCTSYFQYDVTAHKNIISKSFYDFYNLNISLVQIKINKTLPGNFMIPHCDEYSKYDGKSITPTRLWISLTDEKFGHLLVIESECLYHVPKGFCKKINKKDLHFSVNLGYEDRYILLLTG